MPDERARLDAAINRLAAYRDVDVAFVTFSLDYLLRNRWDDLSGHDRRRLLRAIARYETHLSRAVP